MNKNCWNGNRTNSNRNCIKLVTKGIINLNCAWSGFWPTKYLDILSKNSRTGSRTNLNRNCIKLVTSGIKYLNYAWKLSIHIIAQVSGIGKGRRWDRENKLKGGYGWCRWRDKRERNDERYVSLSCCSKVAGCPVWNEINVSSQEKNRTY